ncbi:MAG: lipase family protein [Gammaproteobacteria bacterium]|nr:lipase family protein [Gammaproteobacteria bacterium]
MCFLAPLNAADHPEQDSLNFNNIIQAAGFANAAYLTEVEVAEFTRLNNYTLNLYRTIPESQVAYFIATNELTKSQIISVRGTSNIENTIIDISLKLMTDKRSGLRLHQGFAFAAKQVYVDLQPLLKKDYVINVTGHSLGGAVAMILGMYLDLDGYNVGQITTFGQPKVTNIAGANHFKKLNIIRVVTLLDLVPLVPPFDPLDINNLDIYWHSGKEVLLLSDTKYSILEGISSMLRVTKFTQTALNVENLQNHQMSVYIEQLNLLKEFNELVPYKNNFNLFNLFGG